MTENTKNLILASGSASRQKLLKNANVSFNVKVSGLDESVVKKTFLKDGLPQDLPMILANAKAMSVSENYNDSFVIGADQVLIFDNKIFDKPVSQDDARDQLLALRGKDHRLETAVSIVKNSEIIWTYSETTYLRMREFSLQFLGQYLASQGDDLLTSVGGYKIEGPALQMFSKIDGDFFSILGLPMLPLLDFLRQEEIIQA